MKVVAIVPVYGANKEVPKEFIRNLRDCSAVVIVEAGDHGPGVTKEGKNLFRVYVPKDFYWAKSVNAGIKVSFLCWGMPGYFLLMNADTTFKRDLVSVLVREAEMARSIVQPITLRPDRSVWMSGGYVSWLFGDLCFIRAMKWREPDWLSAQGMLIPGEAIDDVGLMDAKHFPQYMADAEWSMRAKEKGWMLNVVSNAVIINHPESCAHLEECRRSFFGPFFSVRSSFYLPARFALLVKHWPWWGVVPAFAGFLLKAGLIQIARKLKWLPST